jgi:HSP20 family molecular chaperone IbpA
MSKYLNTIPSVSEDSAHQWTAAAIRTGLTPDLFAPFFDDGSRSIYSNDNITPNFINIRFNESKKQFLAEVDLPGVKKENLSVTSEGDHLYISASRTVTRNRISKDETYSRAFKVNPTLYDFDTLGCILQDGMLTITLSRKVKPKKEIKVVQVQ